MSTTITLFCLLTATVSDADPVPGRVLPNFPPSYDMAHSTAVMTCNASGPLNPEWAAQWSLVDIDWSNDKMNGWAKATPMNAEENMLAGATAIKALNNNTIVWVYRNGIKALPWFTTVRLLLEDPQYWGYFMPLAGCMPSPGDYRCGPNATTNLYHDFEQTPRGDCGKGVECGEYVFNHRNESLISWMIPEYFLGKTGGGNPNVGGYYVDDGWTADGPTEMDKDAVVKMGMSTEDVTAMIAAWQANQKAWRAALVAKQLFEWGLFYGGQQTAPGWNQTHPQSSCQSFMTGNCGAESRSQSGALFFGYSRTAHTSPFPPSYPEQDLAAFLLVRGPYAWIGYGWAGCITSPEQFPRPASLSVDYGTPLGFCNETTPGVFTREWTKATISLDCNNWVADFKMKS